MIIGMGQYVHKDYAALQDKVVTDGVSRPSYEQRVKENAWMRNLDSYAGAWTTRNVFYNFRHDGGQDYGYYNWRNPAAHKLGKSGTVTHTSMLGDKGDGSTGVYDTSWNPSTNGGSGWGISNVGISYDLITNASGVHFGSNTTGTNYNYVNGTTQVTRINQSSSGNPTPTSPGIGHFTCNKTTALLNDFYKNGSSNGSIAATELGSLSSANMLIFARRDSGTATNFSACEIGYLSWGGPVPDPAKLHTSLVQFKT